MPINVNDLIKDALESGATHAAMADTSKITGIPYYNGKDTVSYVGLILFNET